MREVWKGGRGGEGRADATLTLPSLSQNILPPTGERAKELGAGIVSGFACGVGPPAPRLPRARSPARSLPSQLPALAVAQSPVPPPPPPPPPNTHTHRQMADPSGYGKEGRRGPWRQRRAGVKRPSRAAGGYMAGCRRDACNPRLLRLHATVDLS